MAEFGFISTTDGVSLGDVVAEKDDDGPDLIYVNPTQTVRDAILLMRKHGVSQLPVAKNEPPFAAAEIMGSVNELRLMEASFEDDGVLSRPVEDVMNAAMPTIGVGQPIELAVELLDHATALLVLEGGRPMTIVSRTDVLNFLSPDEVSP